MKQHMQWQRQFTGSSQDLQAKAPKYFLLAILSFLLASCAGVMRSSQVSVPPAQSVSSSLQTFEQGLRFIRENPSIDAETRVQRFLWLDQWVKTLGDKSMLTPEMAHEHWQDFESILRVDPPLGMNFLQKALARSQTKIARNLLFYRVYLTMLKDRTLDEALKQLELIEDDGITDYYTKSHQLLELNKSDFVSEYKRIGVLVPLTGDLKSFGEEVVQAIQAITQLKLADGVEFIIEDSGTTDEQLLSAWQKLALKDRVRAIIGPLTTKDTELVFERAELVSLPVISLAPKENIESFGAYSFRSFLSIEDQVKKVAEFIELDLKAKRIGILMPDTSYGSDVLSALRSEFQARDLKITELQVYPPKSTDFKNPLERMTRLDFPKLRKNEVCPKEEPMPPGCVKRLQDLKPIIDFEVLLVPDFAESVGLMLPTLPYLRIYGIQVIGLSGIHSPRLIERAKESAEGVILTDSYLASSNQFQNRFFKDRFKAISNKEPSRLAAEAFDVGLLLVELLNKDGGRGDLADRLRSTANFSGITGELYVESQKIKRKPRLLIVRDGDFRELRLN